MKNTTTTIIILSFILISATVFILNQKQIKEQNNLSVNCLNRQIVQSNGKQWLNKVTYNQSAHHDGYRMDCSGFVSMCWQLAKPGLTTSSMSKSSHNITKDQLQKGDAMNCPGYHVVLFMGWSDSSKSHYIGWEQSTKANLTVTRITPYPYWSHTDCFHPIRYNNIC